MNEIDVYDMICDALGATAVRSGDRWEAQRRTLEEVKREWGALSDDEATRRAVQVRAAIAGTPVPWGDIAERVARHAWEVHEAVTHRPGAAQMMYVDRVRESWTRIVDEWVRDGAPPTGAYVASCLAARALAEALGYRLDVAEVPRVIVRAPLAGADVREEERMAAAEALASRILWTDREGYVLRADGTRSPVVPLPENATANAANFDRMVRALLAFKAAL